MPTDRIHEVLAEAIVGRHLLTHPFYRRWEAGTLGEGELAAYEWASIRGGGVVVLSPAAPSFGRYHDYRARAASFASAAAGYGPLT